MNTDPHDQPGQHWLALWTDQNVCEVLDSYALPLERYEQATPLREWIVTTLEVRGDQWQVPASHP